MKDSLADFCYWVHQRLVGLDKDRLDEFFWLRYRVLAEKFPHKSFSVEQAEPDYFEKTLMYLTEELDVDTITKSDYNLNYIQWVKKNR